ncbi:MAG: GNAT family N-acetyltransferase [Rhodoferax sp.]|nr:GNAT family N-acetyltransferase [Rhodoferax sp.]
MALSKGLQAALWEFSADIRRRSRRTSHRQHFGGLQQPGRTGRSGECRCRYRQAFYVSTIKESRCDDFESRFGIASFAAQSKRSRVSPSALVMRRRLCFEVWGLVLFREFIVVPCHTSVQQAMQLTLDQDSSPEWLDLVWSTFFRERGRGQSLIEHFPWLMDLRRSQTWLATMRDDQLHPVAGLAVKRHIAHFDTASVGLVCVRADCRGQGLSQSLVSGAIAQAHALGITRLTLWTGKPSVYLKLGFQPQGPALYGWVRSTTAVGTLITSPTLRAVWPDRAERQSTNRGLPPFAVNAYRLIDRRDRAHAVVVDDGNGPIVAEWQGDDVDVAHLLRASLPAEWRMNALQGDQLPAELISCGLAVNLTESYLQMWRNEAGVSRNAFPSLRLLDRI